MKNVLKNTFIVLSSILFLFTSCNKEKEINSDIEPNIEEKAELGLSIPAIIPQIIITIDDNKEVVEKDEYLNATIEVKGNGNGKDISPVKTKIKGRGNSTWSKPKKPYRLKLDSKMEILGFKAAKD